MKAHRFGLTEARTGMLETRLSSQRESLAMNALTRSASISFDPSALADWTADFYTLDRLTAEHLDAHTPGSLRPLPPGLPDRRSDREAVEAPA
jgi:hypothetical protein